MREFIAKHEKVAWATCATWGDLRSEERGLRMVVQPVAVLPNGERDCCKLGSFRYGDTCRLEQYWREEADKAWGKSKW